ncbi:General transcription and DNA repair factor IIH subunit tfb4 [Cucumispora dikerogammari]|nr:General transcription and DNA repair factor IIH subunit tfb4 [Cucumispora dikerogammari]
MLVIINIHISAYTQQKQVLNTSILDELTCFIKLIETIPSNKILLFNNKNIISNFKELKNSVLETDLSIILLKINKNCFNLTEKKDFKIFVVSLFETQPTQKLLFLREAINKNETKIYLFSDTKSGINLLGPVFKPTFYDFINIFSNPNQNEEVVYYPVKCKCHNIEIKLGFVCPVCLTAYCKKRGICSVCKIKVKI